MSTPYGDLPATSGYLNRRLRDLNEAQTEVGRDRVALRAFADRLRSAIKVKDTAGDSDD